MLNEEVELAVAVEIAGEDEFGDLIAHAPALEGLFDGAARELEAGQRRPETVDFDAVGSSVAGEQDGVLLEEGTGFGTVEAGGDDRGAEAFDVDESVCAGAGALPGEAVTVGGEGEPAGRASAANADGCGLSQKQKGEDECHRKPYD